MANFQPTPPLFAVIRTRTQVLFEGQVKALTSNNEKGVFDILPEHAQFISLIKDFVRLHKVDGTTEIKISTGILKVHENRIDVYVGIESTVDPQSDSQKTPPASAKPSTQ